MKLMMIEDHTDMAEALIAIIGNRTEIVHVTTQKEALDLLSEPASEFDVLLIDGNVPYYSGEAAVPTLQLIREIVSNGFTGMIIGLSGSTELFLKQMCEAGCHTAWAKIGSNISKKLNLLLDSFEKRGS